MRLAQTLATLTLFACGGGDGDDAAAPDAPTWYRDVLPIAQRSCLSCHRTGGIGPFSMESYAGVVNRAPMMADQVAAHTMPPWPPSADCMPLRDARTITEDEIDTIGAWADAGAPEGDPADAPEPPAPPDALADVDLTIQPEGPYTPQGRRPDDYHCFRVDPQLLEDRDVVAYEVVPGLAAEVHHVILYQAPAAAALAKDDEEDGEGWTCFGGTGVGDESMVGGWAPGTPVTRYPDGVGVTLLAGNVLVMQVHYNQDNMPDGPAPDLTSVSLDLADGRVAHPGFFTSVADAGFAIPPDAEGYSTSASTTAGSAITVWGVFPHMHTLGRHIRVDAHVGGQDICVVDIPDWSFHWQQLYLFETPVDADAGDTGTLTCTWDNPTDGTIHWGEGTSDEMCINFYLVTLR